MWEEASRSFYYRNMSVDAVLHIYLCSSAEEMLSVSGTHKRGGRIQRGFEKENLELVRLLLQGDLCLSMSQQFLKYLLSDG